MTRENRVCVGVVSTPYGVRGTLKIKSFTANPASIFDFAELEDAAGNPVRLMAAGQSGQALLATLEGVEDRNAAELLKGKKLYVARDALPETDEDEFYIEDLVGLCVKIADGREVGTVKQVANYGAGDVVEVAFNNGTEELFSFTEASFPQVDIAAGYLILNAPEVLEAKKK